MMCYFLIQIWMILLYERSGMLRESEITRWTLDKKKEIWPRSICYTLWGLLSKIHVTNAEFRTTVLKNSRAWENYFLIQIYSPRSVIMGLGFLLAIISIIKNPASESKKPLK